MDRLEKMLFFKQAWKDEYESFVSQTGPTERRASSFKNMGRKVMEKGENTGEKNSKRKIKNKELSGNTIRKGSQKIQKKKEDK